MKDRFNCIPECKLPTIKDDAIFVCTSIEQNTGYCYLDEKQIHITFQEMDEYGLKPVFYSVLLRISTVKKNRSFFENLKSARIAFKEIKSIERFDNIIKE